MKKIHYCCAATAVFALLGAGLFSQSVEAALFSKNVYCSPIVGTLLWKGKKLAGVTVRRKVDSNSGLDEEVKDISITNNQGVFEFGEVSDRSFIPRGTFEPNTSIGQYLNLEFDGHSYNLWALSKNNYRLGSEVGQSPINLTCDLSVYEDKGTVRLIYCKVNK